MTVLSSVEIQDILPHRYPFLLVDRMLEVEAGKRAVGIKCVTIDEPFFAGHFPGRPVMPGVLIAEAIAQVGAVAVLMTPDFEGMVPFLAGLDGFRFRRQVVPGDVLRLEVELSRLRRTAGRGHGTATVDGDVAAEGDILFVVAPASPG
ncbi:MAG TPA: 3-hydroxyacyl-ACP dehydratase FabZ [Chloroflexota bacterium]|nr:3-hydroxyacyl-ACP dehydratase FabZ [Chloroflexota bacterium]